MRLALPFSVLFLLRIIRAVHNPNKHHFCHASSHHEFFNDTYHLYPLELFFNNTVVKHSNLETKSCYSIDSSVRTNYSCPVNSFAELCPIGLSNVVHMTKASHEWVHPNYFCDLQRFSKHSNETINVIVAGGSVTSGVTAMGCCDQPQCTNVTSIENQYGFRKCAWPYYFAKWLERNSKAKVNLIDISRPGYSSYTTSEFLMSMLLEKGIKYLTNRDIVFLDNSANDKVMRGVAKYMEITIRRLFSNTHPIDNSTMNNATTTVGDIKHTYPHVVIMDTEPMPMGIGAEYRTFYTELAKHYRIPLWSYRDALLSGYNASSTPLSYSSHRHHNVTHNVNKNSTSNVTVHNNIHYGPASGMQTRYNSQIESFLPYLKLDPTIRRDHHPSWYVHLYIADLMADTLSHAVHRCEHGSTSGNSDHYNSEDLTEISTSNLLLNTTDSVKNSILVDANTTVLQHLPQPLYGIHEADSCKVREYLRISYDDIAQKKEYVGKYSTPNDKWQVTTDDKGRGGFIRQLPSTTQISCDGSDNHAKLIFILDATNGELSKESHILTAHIVLMKSYTNVGVISISLCGQLVGGGEKVSTLWNDHLVFRYTLPYVFHINMNVEACEKLDPTMPAELVITHEIQNCMHHNLTLVKPELRQMVKLTQVSVCT